MKNRSGLSKNVMIMAAAILMLSAILVLNISSGYSGGYKNMSSKKGEANMPAKPLHERFASLQDYLDWTDNSRIADIPRYVKISEGRYRFQRSRGQARDDRIYSYEELRDKLGFSR